MRLAVLVSGSGTNLAALLAAEARGELAPGAIVVVVSNRPEAPAVERARASGKEAIVVDHRGFPDRPSFEEAVLAELHARRVEAVVLAGFMRVLTATFLGAFPDRVLNIHPSLLPAFPGVDAQRQAFEHGVKITGCTAHLVTDDLDGGPIVLQAAVPVLDDDDLPRLRARVLAAEHELLPRAVRLLAAGRVVREGRRVVIADGGDPRQRAARTSAGAPDARLRELHATLHGPDADAARAAVLELADEAGRAGAEVVCVSACLLGEPTRHDGADRFVPEVTLPLVADPAVRILPLCPEVLGGMGCPRPSVHFARGDGDVLARGGDALVVDDAGRDHTAALARGAVRADELARLAGARSAILKERSPSCGVNALSGPEGRHRGRGVFSAKLAGRGIPVLSEEDVLKKRTPGSE